MAQWCKYDLVEESDHWVIEHDLNKSTLWIKCYILIENELTCVIPKRTIIVDNSKVEIHFTTKYAGQVLIQ